MGVRLNLSLWFSYNFLCSTVYTKKLVSLVLSWKICCYSSLFQMSYRLLIWIVYLSHVLRHITHDIYSGKTNLDLNIHSTDWINTFYTVLCNFATEKTNLDLHMHIQIIVTQSTHLFEFLVILRENKAYPQRFWVCTLNKYVVYQICKARTLLIVVKILL
jgi:hypothetical protein